VYNAVDGNIHKISSRAAALCVCCSGVSDVARGCGHTYDTTYPDTALKTLSAAVTSTMTSSVTSRRLTSGRHAPPPSALTRHSASASTTVVADVHHDALTAQLQQNSVSGAAPPRTPRDQYRQEVVTSRQRFSVLDDRRGRVLRRPVAELSASAERDQRQWSSLEHGVVDEHRRPSDMTTRRVHSYEDRCLLQRQKGLQPQQQQQQPAMMPHVRRRLPNANDPLRITEFSTSDDFDYDYETSRVYAVRRSPRLSPVRQ